MIYKVYVQENKNEVPVRERTKAIFIEANTVGEVYIKLEQTPYRIEHIQPLDKASLDYEKKYENFKVMEI